MFGRTTEELDQIYSYEEILTASQQQEKEYLLKKERQKKMDRLKRIGFGLGLGLLSVGTVALAANAHYTPNHENHAHVCTQSTSLNVRSGPNGKIIGSVHKGALVTIKGSYSNWETNQTWYEIYLQNGSTGYISGDYVCF